MEKITVIGAGTMGNGIAQVFAQAGFEVALCDVAEDRLGAAVINISASVDRLEKKGIILAGQKETILKNISTTTSVSHACSDANLVVEAATENRAVKLNLFSQLDKASPPGSLLASNTSSISITEIAAATSRPESVIGMHFMNPVPVMRLVEVINGFLTAAATTDRIIGYCKLLDKEPVAAQDYPGFIANRILMPMINEAVYTLFEGVAGVSEIDTVMKLGMAHPMGPLLLADFIGLDVCVAILNVLYAGFGNPKYAVCPLLTNMVNAGQFGKKSGSGFYEYSNDKFVKVACQFS